MDGIRRNREGKEEKARRRYCSLGIRPSRLVGEPRRGSETEEVRKRLTPDPFARSRKQLA